MLNTTFKFISMENLDGYCIEWKDSEGYIVSHKNKLYTSKNIYDIGSFKLLAEISLPLWVQMLLKIRIAQRALRIFFYNVIKIQDESLMLLISFGNKLFVYKNGELVEITGIDKKFKILRGGCAIDNEGGAFFGEYFSNYERLPVNIYYLKKNETNADVVYTFPRGEIRHVHGLFWDPYTFDIWCTTGDIGRECKIIKSSNKFKTIETVGSGDETWRAVSLIFTSTHIYYGMDAEFLINKIYRINRKNYLREEIGTIDGPVYYSKKIYENKILFSVAAEGAPSQQLNNASLWLVDDCNILKLLDFKKDIYPNILLPGTIHFPLGDQLSKDDLFINFNCLSKLDQKNYKIVLDNLIY